MLENEVFFLLLQALPESIIITSICFYLLNIKLEWKKILLIAIFETITNIVNYLPLSFGMPTIILVLAQALYIRIITNYKLSRIFIAVITCLIVIALSESISTGPLLNYFGLEYKQVYSTPYLRALFSLPGYIALLLIPAVKKSYLLIQSKKAFKS